MEGAHARPQKKKKSKQANRTHRGGDLFAHGLRLEFAGGVALFSHIFGFKNVYVSACVAWRLADGVV